MEKILNLIDPALKYIDSGSFFRQPFKWLYYVLGILNILIPIWLINITSDIAKYASGKIVTCLVLLIIISVPLAFFGAMIWIKRGNNLNNDASNNSRFIAIPILANLIQTMGEWLGYMIGVGGFIAVLLLLLFGGGELSYYLPVGASFAMLIVYPIIGFLIILVARFIAENFLAIASIANNTQAIKKEV
ncbi:MAG: hypothetical protein K2K94_10470, partial [Muribaculaceae bacterium]|nr:hypothetical protein [Muribaculaceae bacterium]